MIVRLEKPAGNFLSIQILFSINLNYMFIATGLRYRISIHFKNSSKYSKIKKYPFMGLNHDPMHRIKLENKYFISINVKYARSSLPQPLLNLIFVFFFSNNCASRYLVYQISAEQNASYDELIKKQHQKIKSSQIILSVYFGSILPMKI
ncbi:hypothetical protein BpHYR1_050902 [Brachionus plicatilis]|uniref:Uncharacterized protein n=1 Tax=Brachionus plicatilis TaxID=10195 RepID=A0A3M7RJS7_BRAPC|nr:hypothetical protein BpHYR1_050902 [Brachionus plicatilis]